MFALNSRRILATLICAALVSGCTQTRNARVTGESVVLVGQEPAALAHVPAHGQPVQVRSAYTPAHGQLFVEGQDYILDSEDGTIRRTPHSRLPDFKTNVLFGQRQFDHSQFPGFGNGGFFAFIDYSYIPTQPWPVEPSQIVFLQSTLNKLRTGESVRIIAYGDSITAGGDATRPELIFWQRWANDLQARYPRAHITAVNGATGGDSTVQGLMRLQTKVLDQNPDLVLVGFGMNDHNVGGVPIPQFETNLTEIIMRVRAVTHAEIVLFSAFPPNPEWRFGTHRMSEYAAATKKVAAENTCAYADIFSNWQAIAQRKKPEDLLGNNINHPNDFGHWIYFRVFQGLGL